MLIDAKYYVASLTSFCDVLGESGIAFGYESWYMREIAMSISEKTDNLILYGPVDSRPTEAFYRGLEISIAYDNDGNEFYCYVQRNSISILEQKPEGGFRLIEQILVNPFKKL